MNLETDNKIHKKGITLVIPNPCGNIKETKMKNSGIEWIGEIPEDWEVKKVKHSFVRKNEKAMQENPIVLSLARSGVRERDISNNEGQLAESYYNYNPVDVDDLLINPMDLYSGANCSISKVKGVISPAYINLRAKKNVSPVFYDYYFKVQYWMMAFFAHGNGVSFENRWTLNNETLQNYPIVAPSFETQQRIATYLDKKCNKIEETILNQQQVIEKLKAYKQSLITETVTGKVKIVNGKVCGEYESYKDSGVEWIGKIPSKWISTRVGHLYKSMLGKMVCPNQLTEEHSLQKYLCAMNVHFDGVDLSEIKEMWFTPNEMNQYQVRNGDLLVVEGGAGAGGASIVYGLSENDKIFIQNSIHLVKPVKTNYLPKYLYYWIYSLVKQNYIDYTCNKATIPHFTKEKLEGMPIAISDKITQQEIIVYLDKKCTAIDTAIEQKQNLIEKLTEYKKSLIYECVTGKKEI